MPSKKRRSDQLETTLEVTQAEMLALLEKESGRGRSKYGNKRIEADGYTFDSQAEYRYYLYLKSLQENIEIDGLEVHPVYQLIPDFVDYAGEAHKGITYEADFTYYGKDGKRVVVDIKGVQTDVFKLKHKLFLWKYQHSTVLVLIDAKEV